MNAMHFWWASTRSAYNKIFWLKSSTVIHRVRIGSLGKPVSVTAASVRMGEHSAQGRLKESARVTAVAVSLSRPPEFPTTEPTANAAPLHRDAETTQTPQYVHNSRRSTNSVYIHNT